MDVQDNVSRFFAIDHVLVSFVTIATTGAIFSLQFTKNRLGAGLRPDPLGKRTGREGKGERKQERKEKGEEGWRWPP